MNQGTNGRQAETKKGERNAERRPAVVKQILLYTKTVHISKLGSNEGNTEIFSNGLPQP
jgi:hypothetical protein